MKPFGFFSSQPVWDSDAQLIFNAVTDVPGNIRSAINNLILSHKSNSLWTKLKYGIIAIPSMNGENAFRDIKTNTILASANGASALSGRRVCAYPIGYLARNGEGDYINTGVAMSSLNSINSSALVCGDFLNNDSGTTGFDFGALQAAKQRAIFLVRNSSNQSLSQMYDSTNTLTITGITDKRGIWIFNRNANNFLECLLNGTQLGTKTTAETGTSLPSINTHVFGYNNNGGRGGDYSGIKDMFCHYDGLTTSERSTIATIWATFRTEMGRVTPTKQIILDGNSLNLYAQTGGQRMFRRAMYELSVADKVNNNVLVYNFSVAGQTTTQMSADYATQVAPIYSAGFSKNIYIINEILNDMYVNGTTVAQAKTNMQALISSAQTTGFQVILIVPQARTYVGANVAYNQTTWNLGVDSVVQWIRAGSSGANYICDVTDSNLWVDRSSYASDAAYNTAISAITGNSTYFTDATHLTDVGFDSRGYALKNVLVSVL